MICLQLMKSVYWKERWLSIKSCFVGLKTDNASKNIYLVFELSDKSNKVLNVKCILYC